MACSPKYAGGGQSACRPSAASSGASASRPKNFHFVSCGAVQSNHLQLIYPIFTILQEESSFEQENCLCLMVMTPTIAERAIEQGKVEKSAPPAWRAQPGGLASAALAGSWLAPQQGTALCRGLGSPWNRT